MLKLYHLQKLRTARVAGSRDDGGGVGEARRQARALDGSGCAAAWRAADAGHQRRCAVVLEAAATGDVMGRA